MRIGLLVCDHVNPELRHVSGDYPDMFRRLFSGHPEVELVVYDAVNGEVPSDPAECDAWMTTGSRHSVNDELEWIGRLEAFVREVARAKVPFVGVCFGHQLLAKALGGRVAKSDRGWGVGVTEVEVDERLGIGDRYRVVSSHQDQVVELPTGAEVLGWTEHCPVSVMAVGETMVGIQGHPEFDVRYAEALLALRRGTVIPEETADAALATLEVDPDREALASWILGLVT